MPDESIPLLVVYDEDPALAPRLTAMLAAPRYATLSAVRMYAAAPRLELLMQPGPAIDTFYTVHGPPQEPFELETSRGTTYTAQQPLPRGSSASRYTFIPAAAGNATGWLSLRLSGTQGTTETASLYRTASAVFTPAADACREAAVGSPLPPGVVHPVLSHRRPA